MLWWPTKKLYMHMHTVSDLWQIFFSCSLRGEGKTRGSAGAELQSGAPGAGGRDMLLRGAGGGADPGPIPRLQPQHQLRGGLRRPVGLPRGHFRLMTL